MNKIVHAFVKAHQFTLKFYPPRFQEEYGEEMACVFSAACQEKAKISNSSVLKLGLYELRDLPMNLFREHVNEIWRGNMQPQSYPTEPLPKSIVRGALAFAIGFFVINLIYCLIETFYNAGDTLTQSKSIWSNFFFLHPTALACGLSAGILGLSCGKKKAVGSAMAAYLAYTLIFSIWMATYMAQRSSTPSNLIITLEPYIFSTLAGGLVGGVIGWIQHGWKKAGWYALAGIIGFNLGFIVRNTISLFLIKHSPYFGNMDHLIVGNNWYFILLLIPILFYASVVGICMGISWGNVNQWMGRKSVSAP